MNKICTKVDEQTSQYPPPLIRPNCTPTRRGISTGIQHPNAVRKLTFQPFAIARARDRRARTIFPGRRGPGGGEGEGEDVPHRDEMDDTSSERTAINSESEKTPLVLTNASTQILLTSA